MRSLVETTPRGNEGAGAEGLPVHVIAPSGRWAGFRLRELWENRELLYFLIWRDLKIRYKQTAIGAAWAIIQPLVAMVIFSLFFGRLARMPSEGFPYPIFSYAALLPWQFFAKALTEAGTSLVASERVITKVFFPRILVPTAVVLGGLVDFAIAFAVLLGMMVWYGITPSLASLAAPGFLALAVLTALGVGFWLAALDVEFRDVRYTLPLLTQLWLFATPVVYPSALVPQGWRVWYGLNPMVGVIDGFRWALLGTRAPDPRMLLVSAATILVVFLSGLAYFRRVERTLADRI